MTPSPVLENVVASLLAADFNSWQQIGDYLSREWPTLSAKIMTWAGLISVLAAVWWASAIYLRRRMGRTINSPRRLFRELCRAQRLNWKEVALLHELGDLRGTDVPTQFFVSEDYFTFEVGVLDEKTQREAELLRRKLFASGGAATAESQQAAELNQPIDLQPAEAS